MNPAKALAAWGPSAHARGESRAAAIESDALALWSRATGLQLEAAWVGAGVRDLLERLVPAFDAVVDEFWCPEDVYRVYAEILGARMRREYRTIPDVEWNSLGRSSRRAALLCPVPLSPLGRNLDANEAAGIAAWLAESNDRYLLVDAVYAYEFEALGRVLAPLVRTGRAVVLFSCTKSWLLPGALGLGATSTLLHARITPQAPRAPDLSLAPAWLDEHPDLPHRQQRAFAREWQRLAPRIIDAAPRWLPPETGYFSVVNVPFERLLERHDVLAVPASVFGSRSRDHSIVTCLHDLVAHERAAS
jgi:aspartate/methionine/tyrosine aminotransferase